MIGLTKDDLLKFAEKYNTRAESAYRNYQETGLARYDRERRNAEDMAEAMMAAASAAEDHNALLSVRSEFIWVAHNAEAALSTDDHEKMVEILKGVINYASAVCNYKRREA